MRKLVLLVSLFLFCISGEASDKKCRGLCNSRKVRQYVHRVKKAQEAKAEERRRAVEDAARCIADAAAKEAEARARTVEENKDNGQYVCKRTYQYKGRKKKACFKQKCKKLK